MANNPMHLAGAIDAGCAGDKSARFLQLCEVFGLPVLFLCDTPGFFAGSFVRHVSRLFVVGGGC